MKQQEIANADNRRINLLMKENTIPYKLIKTQAFVIPSNTGTTIIRNFREIINLKRYYNFFSVNPYEVGSHLMSDQNKCEIIRFTDKLNIPLVIKRIEKLDQVETWNVNVKTFNSKMLNWRILQSNKSNRIDKSQALNYKISDSKINLDYAFCLKNKKDCKLCNQKCQFSLNNLLFENFNLADSIHRRFI